MDTSTKTINLRTISGDIVMGVLSSQEWLIRRAMEFSCFRGFVEKGKVWLVARRQDEGSN